MKAFKLCCDAGHGADNSGAGSGYDPGACAGGMQEATIALDWVLTLKYYLSAAGIPFYLTRDDATDRTPVSSRDEKAERAGCSHFLSIHCNSGAAKATGVETFYRDAADREWARVVQGCGVAATGLKSRGLKQERESARGRLAVFEFDGPAALLEVGFISNLTDRSIIAVKETRAAFARRLVMAIQLMRDGA